jgi:hypothetical protein
MRRKQVVNYLKSVRKGKMLIKGVKIFEGCDAQNRAKLHTRVEKMP